MPRERSWMSVNSHFFAGPTLGAQNPVEKWNSAVHLQIDWNQNARAKGVAHASTFASVTRLRGGDHE